MTVVAAVSYGLNLVPPFAVYSLALAFTNIHTHRNKHTLYSRFWGTIFYIVLGFPHICMGFVNEVKLPPQLLRVAIERVHWNERSVWFVQAKVSNKIGNNLIYAFGADTHTYTHMHMNRLASICVLMCVRMCILSLNLRFYAFPFAYFESLVHTYHTHIRKLATHYTQHTHIGILISVIRICRFCFASFLPFSDHWLRLWLFTLVFVQFYCDCFLMFFLISFLFIQHTLHTHFTLVNWCFR